MEPITETVTLTSTTAEAFEVFAGRVGEWWPPSYSPAPDPLDTVVIEPMIGGRVFMRMVDGDEHHFGEVTSWSPGQIYAQTWTWTWTWPWPGPGTPELADGDLHTDR